MENLFKDAAWIMADTDGDASPTHRYYLYTASFDVTADAPVTLYISAFSQYAAFVNDTFADAGVFEDYDFHPVYDTIDLTPFCKPGRNTLTVGHYVCGENFSTRAKGTPGVIFAVLQDGKTIAASSAKTQSTHDTRYLDTHERLTYQLGFNAEFDARASLPPFRDSIPVEKPRELAPRPIEKLTIGAPIDAKLTAQGIFRENDASLPKAERMYTAFLSAKPFSAVAHTAGGSHLAFGKNDAADGLYFFYDLGGETAGYLSFSCDVPEDTEILVGFGEHYEDLRVRSLLGTRHFCFRFIAKKGHNDFFYPFQRIGLRYLQLHVYASEATLQNVGVRPTDYPLTVYPCPTGDGLHKLIYEVGVKTLRMCMHEHYEDCPWREQSLYGMDSRIQILCGYYAFREFRFPRASLALMARSFRPHDALLELCAPGRVSITIPSFTAIFLREVYEYRCYSGDNTLVSELFPTLRAIADGFVSRIDDTGLIPLYTGAEHWNFYEWRDGLEGSERFADTEKVYEAPLCAFVADALECFAALCETTEPKLIAKYAAAAASLKEAAHKAFFDPAHGAYRTRLTDAAPRHDLTQALMLYTDSTPSAYVPLVEKALASETLIPVSLSMTIFAYEAFLKRGRRKKEILTEIETRWGAMLKRGADTFWETDKGADDFSRAGSLCHGWSAVPVYMFGKYYAEDVFGGV